MPLNRQWILRKRPEGLVKDDDLELVSIPTPDLKDGEVLVRTIYLSLDPTNRTWMNDKVGYLPPVGLGDVMRGLTLGVVEETKSDRFKVGEVIPPGLKRDEAEARVHAAINALTPEA